MKWDVEVVGEAALHTYYLSKDIEGLSSTAFFKWAYIVFLCFNWGCLSLVADRGCDAVGCSSKDNVQNMKCPMSWNLHI